MTPSPPSSEQREAESASPPKSNLKPSKYQTAPSPEPERVIERPETASSPRRKPHRYEDRDVTDSDNDDIDDDFIYDASWKEVFESCCCHSLYEWVSILLSMTLILGCLYFFGLGLDFLSSGAKVMTGCATGELFGSETNPVAGLMTGILATVFLQSSSTTTSIIVGLVGAENSIVSVRLGIYMIMGANIGTSVTSTIVSLGHFADRSQLELAFAGATVHDLFNFLSVAVLFPLEVATGYLNSLAAALARGADTEDGKVWKGPAKRYISPLGKLVLIANKSVTKSVAGGGSCDEFYPVGCDDPSHPTAGTCKAGLISCDKSTGKCPIFFQADASRYEDQLSGFVVFIFGLVLIFLALFMLVRALQSLLLDVSIRVLYKATDLNGYVLIACGTAITMFLQSSSTTTSIITPVVGMGALRLEQMYPITIGANIGTTLTAVLAALATDGNSSLQVALAHLMFNISGMMIWFPIPYLRRIPVAFAERLGQAAGSWRGFPLLYIFVVFFLFPALMLLLSAMFEEGIDKDDNVLVAIGSLITVVLFGLIVWGVMWWNCFGGGEKIYHIIDSRIRVHMAVTSLAKDMIRAKTIVAGLRESTLLEDGVEAPSKKEENQTNSGILSEITRLLERRKEIKKAMQSLPDDMKAIDNKLTLLIQATAESIESIDRSGTKKLQQMQKTPDISYYDENGAVWMLIPFAYKLGFVCFFVLVIAALPGMFTNHARAWHGFGSFLIAFMILAGLYFVFWWNYRKGRKKMLKRFFEQHERRQALAALPEDMMYLQTSILELNIHNGLIESGQNNA